MKINLVIFFATLLFFISSCKQKSNSAGETSFTELNNKPENFKIPVKVITVRRGNIGLKITIYGVLKAVRKTNLAGQIDGRILNLNLSEGDRVKKKDVIALIQSVRAEALKNNSRNSLIANEILPLKIKAPFDGIILKKFHFSQDVVARGEPIVSLEDDSEYYVWGKLPSVYLSTVKPGCKIVVTFPGITGKKFYTKVEKINSIVDSATQMAQLRAKIKNTNYFLKENLFAKIQIKTTGNKNVIVAPQKALLKDSNGIFVFIVNKGRAIKKRIKIGLSNYFEVEILKGLNEGDSLIINGNYLLKEGELVEAKL